MLISIAKYIVSIALLLISSVVTAQDAPKAETITKPGQVYQSAVHKDWQILCSSSNNEVDPCSMYQLIKDKDGHPTAEINIVRVEATEGISAAATILTPHRTLLTKRMILRLDEDSVSDYPYSWCDERGCHIRIAFTDDDVLTMKNGQFGEIEIENITAPGKPIVLRLSYFGFTAAFGALQR